METLKRADYPPPGGPVVLVIMDGVGIGKYAEGDAVRSALKPHLDWLKANALNSQLKAHGRAVGLPSDGDMGNSEVGHNAIGCGRVFDQGAMLVNAAIQSGAMFRDAVWTELIRNCKEHNSTLHFIGLFSDGNVHSHMDHLKAMLVQARKEGVRKARVHVLLDGRDVGETSALDYVDPFEEFLAGLNADGSVDYRIASGGGRMQITMDRYNANWDMVKRGWDTHVRGVGPQFVSARQAIEAQRMAHPGVIDQDLPPFVIATDGKPLETRGKPVGPIRDNDSVIYFNFRGDRAIEISRAFEDDDFSEFDRNPRPKVLYAGMMQYDGDTKIPKRFLVTPPAINRTLGEFLARAGVRQLAISETQKFGHVTYFFNGNRSGKFDDRLEAYVEVPSDIVPFEQRPWMKAAEITDRVVAAIAENKFPFIRLNYPNGDMVGHTGVFQATQIAVESVDLCVGRLMQAVEAAQGVLIVSADHGNADDMLEHDEKTGKVKVDKDSGKLKVKTAHSLNPVPVFIYDPSKAMNLNLARRAGLGISSLAATCLVLLGFVPPEDYDPSIVKIKN
ncbi:MAG: 2,3-bisphosphoglycerate-independent phosphoglycerate mutase [Verrucomicrobia bacterium]|nr:2,3-bisphosphoglycerate-independent phosphoglycerate mutase [Verrucomicrobiota bacterium]MBU4290681.1 2,3-bisphosphoglycerate-independent phosphoglycerate mutase [Verrucomicrobiota bacterium]MBU4429820.1 2,3-bisphosphoglycerate-independent phosphoglycerate mutase [Verrucomicrobiota bacterium]MCG2678902.1 2,3-bisphosphoglycerate-independent phosphoglycerate mutase [Kiritimatiellia bacterium]